MKIDRSSWLVLPLSLALAAITAGCAAGADDDAEDTASSQDALEQASEASPTWHRPKQGTAEYNAVLGALDAKYENVLDTSMDVKLGAPSRLRVSNNGKWAFVRVQPDLYKHGTTERIYANGDLYALLNADASGRWKVVEHEEASDLTGYDLEGIWERAHPALPKSVIPRL